MKSSTVGAGIKVCMSECTGYMVLLKLFIATNYRLWIHTTYMILKFNDHQSYLHSQYTTLRALRGDTA